MNRKYFLLVIFLFLQTIIIYSQPNQLKAVLTSIGNYNYDSEKQLGFLLGEGYAANDIKTGLLAQAWNSSDITILSNSFATKTAITSAISALPSGSGTTNLFFFGGHGDSNYGIYTYNESLQGSPFPIQDPPYFWYRTNIEYISPNDLQSYFSGKNYCAFIEACYSGIFTQISNGYVATSSSENELSAGPPGGGVGYFTSKLEYSLTYGPFEKGSVTADDLFDYAAPLTVTASGGAQHPQSNGHTNGSLLLTKPAYNVSIENKFTGLSNQGTIKINNNIISLPENNRREYYDTSLQLEVMDQTINGIDYTFSHWENSSTSYTRSISVTSAVNPQSYFSGKPSIANRNQHITSSNGQLITLEWNAHPNQYVTEYHVYRKIGHTGTPSHIATTSNTTFTDPDYTMTGSSEDTYLMYDVRPYYSVEQKESDSYFQSAAFGRIESSMTENKEMASILETRPDEYSISNYPNPFNPTTTINYQLPENGFVTIKVYDLLGKEVATLVNENKSAGYHRINFDAGKLTSGVYVYTITANQFIQSKKMMLMK